VCKKPILLSVCSGNHKEVLYEYSKLRKDLIIKSFQTSTTSLSKIGVRDNIILMSPFKFTHPLIMTFDVIVHPVLIQDMIEHQMLLKCIDDNCESIIEKDFKQNNIYPEIVTMMRQNIMSIEDVIGFKINIEFRRDDSIEELFEKFDKLKFKINDLLLHPKMYKSLKNMNNWKLFEKSILNPLSDFRKNTQSWVELYKNLRLK
jgi:hypothetical protein